MILHLCSQYLGIWMYLYATPQHSRRPCTLSDERLSHTFIDIELGIDIEFGIAMGCLNSIVVWSTTQIWLLTDLQTLFLNVMLFRWNFMARVVRKWKWRSLYATTVLADSMTVYAVTQPLDIGQADTCYIYYICETKVSSGEDWVGHIVIHFRIVSGSVFSYPGQCRQRQRWSRTRWPRSFQSISWRVRRTSAAGSPRRSPAVQPQHLHRFVWGQRIEHRHDTHWLQYLIHANTMSRMKR